MVSRSKSRLLRHALANGLALCHSCHFRFHNKESQTAWEWFKQNRPEDYEFIRAHKDTPCKDKFEDVLFRLKGLLEVIQEEAA